MKSSSFPFLLLAFSYSSMATEQVKDSIRIGEGYHSFDQKPLSQLISDKDFHELYKPKICSSSWRGYVGEWALIQKVFYLVHLAQSCPDDDQYIDKCKIIDNCEFAVPVKASWFTGELVIPISEEEMISEKTTGEEQRKLRYQAVVYRIEN